MKTTCWGLDWDTDDTDQFKEKLTLSVPTFLHPKHLHLCSFFFSPTFKVLLLKYFISFVILVFKYLAGLDPMKLALFIHFQVPVFLCTPKGMTWVLFIGFES